MDRRSRKTRSQLTEAVVSLMQEQSWESITIQQICDRADIARSTYYLHFPGKQELLDYSFRHLADHLRSAPRKRSLDRDGAFGVLPVLLHMMTTPEHGFLFQEQQGSSMFHVTRALLMKVIVELMAEEIRHSSTVEKVPALALDFAAAGVLSTIEAWHQGRTSRDLSKVSATLDDLVGRVLGLSR